MVVVTTDIVVPTCMLGGTLLQRAKQICACFAENSPPPQSDPPHLFLSIIKAL